MDQSKASASAAASGNPSRRGRACALEFGRTPAVARATGGRSADDNARPAVLAGRAFRERRVSHKPNSVGLLRDDHLTGMAVSRHLDATDPGVVTERDTLLPLYAVLLQAGFTEPVTSPSPLVSSYLTVSPLPAAAAPCGAPPVGGLLSVALSVGSRPLGVTQRLALWSSDFPHGPASAAAFAEESARTARSPGRLGTTLATTPGRAPH